MNTEFNILYFIKFKTVLKLNIHFKKQIRRYTPYSDNKMSYSHKIMSYPDIIMHILIA